MHTPTTHTPTPIQHKHPHTYIIYTHTHSNLHIIRGDFQGARAGAICPFTVTAVGEVNCGTFSVEVFENLFENVFYGQEGGSKCIQILK